MPRVNYKHAAYHYIAKLQYSRLAANYGYHNNGYHNNDYRQYCYSATIAFGIKDMVGKRLSTDSTSIPEAVIEVGGDDESVRGLIAIIGLSSIPELLLFPKMANV